MRQQKWVWLNQAIRPEINSSEAFVEDAKNSKALRKAELGQCFHIPDGLSEELALWLCL